MPSSISSSDPRAGRHWLSTWLLAIALAAAALWATEGYWQRQGYRADIVDSPQLWSLERGKVYDRQRTPLVLLGASRIQFSIDMPLLRELLPRYRPVMLAINGRYPLATLRDLANDDAFRGIVLCDVDGRGLTREYREMQAGYVDYFRHHWTPSWLLHRLVLTSWQRHWRIAKPEHGAVAALKRWIASAPPPYKPYHYFRRDRSGDIHFDETDVPALVRHFEADLKQSLDSIAIPPPQEWLAQLADVNSWVDRIQARGGRVIFYEAPVTGSFRQLNQQYFPRADYWEPFVAATAAANVNYADIPALAQIPLPDQLHLDYHDKPTYTRALVDALVERGLLQR